MTSSCTSAQACSNSSAENSRSTSGVGSVPATARQPQYANAGRSRLPPRSTNSSRASVSTA